MQAWFQKITDQIKGWFFEKLAYVNFSDIRLRAGLGLLAVLLIGAASFYIYLFQRDGRSNLLSGHYKIAYHQYIKAAEGGDPRAANVIGNLYYLGLGVSRNKFLAARWYLKAALKGYVPSQINLGQMYWNGQGVPKRPLNAVGWFNLARKGGSERADGHIRYMILANAILPNMIEAAKNRYEDLKVVNRRYSSMGEMAFLLK